MKFELGTEISTVFIDTWGVGYGRLPENDKAYRQSLSLPWTKVEGMTGHLNLFRKKLNFQGQLVQVVKISAFVSKAIGVILH